MRLFSVLLAVSMSGAAWAEQPPSAEVPPPPAMEPADQPVDGEPEVTIKQEKGQTIEEYRMGGRLYMIKVTPKGGKPYYLVDDRGDGKFARQDSLDSGLRVPRWVIHQF